MVILHKAQRTDGEGEVKGFITKMWGEYHIICENDENTAYPVLEDTIKPCFHIKGDIIQLNMDSKATTFNPMDFDKNSLTREDILSRVQDIANLNTLLNLKKDPKDILEEVNSRNDLLLSDKDKEDILSLLEK